MLIVIQASVILCCTKLFISQQSVPSQTIQCSMCFDFKSWVWYFKELFICRSIVTEYLIKVNGRVYIPLISNLITITLSAYKNQSYYQFSQSYTKPFCKDHYIKSHAQIS